MVRSKRSHLERPVIAIAEVGNVSGGAPMTCMTSESELEREIIVLSRRKIFTGTMYTAQCGSRRAQFPRTFRVPSTGQPLQHWHRV
jgi:hypothetical protein